MAFKVFTNGSVLQASEVNENLMRQSVSTFSNAAARTAAITAPSEGMVTYLEDSDLISIYESGAWRTSLSPRGGIIQVVQGTTSTITQSTSATFADTGLTATITPKSASNRILVIVSQPFALVSSSNNSVAEFAILRGSTNIHFTYAQINAGLGASSLLINAGIINMTDLDSPATTAATTYKTQFRHTVGLRTEAGYLNAPASITLMEVSS